MSGQSPARRLRREHVDYAASLTRSDGSWIEQPPTDAERVRVDQAYRVLREQRRIAVEFHKEPEQANLFSLELFRAETFAPLHFDDWIIEQMIEACGEPPVVEGEDQSEFSEYLRQAVLSVANSRLRRALGAQLRRFLPQFVEAGKLREAVAIDYNAHWTIFGNITTPFLVQMALAGLARYYEAEED
jgi:hypothetical protein